MRFLLVCFSVCCFVYAGEFAAVGITIDYRDFGESCVVDGPLVGQCGSGLFCSENSVCEYTAGCPDGFTEIESEFVLLGTDYCLTNIGDAQSCSEIGYTGKCVKYVAEGVSFSDGSGVYKFADPCLYSD